MSKPESMSQELWEKITSYNKEKAAVQEKANDFMTVLMALPSGQVKNLLKDPVIGPIIEKYVVTE